MSDYDEGAREIELDELDREHLYRLILSLESQVRELRKPAVCNVCTGDTSVDCICGGIGTEYAELNGLRDESIKLRKHVRKLEAKLERVRGLPSEWESEAQTRATTDESYSINGAYQVCAHQLRAALTEETP